MKKIFIGIALFENHREVLFDTCAKSIDECSKKIKEEYSTGFMGQDYQNCKIDIVQFNETKYKYDYCHKD